MSAASITSRSAVIETGPYAGYRVVVSLSDDPKRVHYAESVDGGSLLRVHYRVTRIPSRRTFMIHHLAGSTDADRDAAVRRISSIARCFAACEAAGAVRRTRMATDRAKWIFFAFGGQPVADPLVQLELEMMIDSAGMLSAGHG